MRSGSAYPANLPLCALKTAETLLVTTSRLFLFAPATAQAEFPWWEGLWRATGDFQAASCLEQLLCVLETTSVHPLDMRCPCSHELGEDEGRLLQLIALYQQRRPQAACAILSEWLPASACRLAAAPASDLARRLARCRLLVPWRCNPGNFPPPLHSDPGFGLVQ